jgi:outer membrane protein assembly factor BamD (BamD/ComL family)
MKQLLLFSLLATVLAACSGPSARELYDEARAAEDTNAVLAIEKYEELVRLHPAEALAETAMYKIVMFRQNQPGDRTPALESQRRFLSLYPDSPRASKVLFMHAFLYNNELREADSAKKYYELFLATYPGDELAPSAKFELENLGRGPEELIGDDAAAATAAGKRPGPGGRP